MISSRNSGKIPTRRLKKKSGSALFSPPFDLRFAVWTAATRRGPSMVSTKSLAILSASASGRSSGSNSQRERTFHFSSGPSSVIAQARSSNCFFCSSKKTLYATLSPTNNAVVSFSPFLSRWNPCGASEAPVFSTIRSNAF